jgi:hypothetical protein
MNRYGIFLILLAPLLPAFVSITVHPLLNLRDAWIDRGVARAVGASGSATSPH